MAKPQAPSQGVVPKPAPTGVAPKAPIGVAPKKKPRATPLEFLAQVRAEGEKVTWPSRKETLVTSAMVFVMVVVASAFFLIADFIMQKVVGLVLGLGG